MLRFWILKIRKPGAFLLVEVLLTIAILATGLTAVVRSFLVGLRASKLASDYLQAELLVENELSLQESLGEIDADLQIEEPFKAPVDKFKFKITTENITLDNQIDTLNKVTASVIWPGQKTNQKISLFTYLKNKINEEGQ